MKLVYSLVAALFWALIRSQGIYQQALAKTSGSTVGHINVKDIVNFQGYCPPLVLQHKFASTVADSEQLREKQKQSEIELENLFQALLQKYLDDTFLTLKHQL